MTSEPEESDTAFRRGSWLNRAAGWSGRSEATNAQAKTQKCPQKDSNLRTWLRRPVLYPLSYGGSLTEKGYQSGDVPVTREPHLMFTLG